MPIKIRNEQQSLGRFVYYHKKERLAILSELFSNLENHYLLLYMKEKSLNFDYQKLKSQSLKTESLTPDDFSLKVHTNSNPKLKDYIIFKQAKSNLDFLDRILKIGAIFQDTHLELNLKEDRPFIETGLRFFPIIKDGHRKIVLSSYIENYFQQISTINNDTESEIAIGDELLEVDQIPVEKFIGQLKQFISGSSEDYVSQKAITAITYRNFFYPKKQYMWLRLKKAGMIKVPVYAPINSASQTMRQDAKFYFQHIGIETTFKLYNFQRSLESKQWRSDPLKNIGYSRVSGHQHLNDKSEYYSFDTPQDGAVLRKGIFEHKSMKAGYLQILNFNGQSFWLRNPKTQSRISFKEQIKSILREFQSENLPLILDLRNNPGGSLSLVNELLALLLPKNSTVASYSVSIPVSKLSRHILGYGQLDIFQNPQSPTNLSPDQIFDVFQQSQEKDLLLTPMMQYSLISTDADIDGFNSPIVTLISPHCISACDLAAQLLKYYNLTQTLGASTNGAGTGYNVRGPYDSSWKDASQLFQFSSPNYLFGLPAPKDRKREFNAKDIIVFDELSPYILNIENRPLPADIPYEISLENDVLNHNRGWMVKALDTLHSQEHSK